jgi:hypothetical protein
VNIQLGVARKNFTLLSVYKFPAFEMRTWNTNEDLNYFYDMNGTDLLNPAVRAEPAQAAQPHRPN